MSAIFTLAIKDLRLLLRDRISLFWILVFPLIFALFFGSLFGGGDDERGEMPVIVFDESDGAADEFITRLQDSDAIAIDQAQSLDAARDLVRRGKRVAFLHIRPGFSDGGFAMFGRDPDDDAAVGLGVDPSRTAERGLLEGLVTQSLFGGMTSQFSDPAKMREQTEQVRKQVAGATSAMSPAERQSLTTLMDALDNLSVATNETNEAATGETAAATPMGQGMVESVDVDPDRAGRPRSPYEITFSSAIVWGLVGCATAFATTMVREQRAGTMLRLRVSPLSRAQILAGKGLACVLAGLGASVVLITIGVVALGVRIGNPVLLLLALVAAAACFTGLMMVMSVIGKTEASVSGGSWSIMLPLAMVGGGMIPLVAMPKWLLTAGSISPFKWAIYSIEGAVWRDLTFAQVLPSLLVLLGIAVVLFTLGVAISKRRDP